MSAVKAHLNSQKELVKQEMVALFMGSHAVSEIYPNSFRWNLIQSSCLVRNSTGGSTAKDRTLQPDQGSHVLAAQLTQTARVIQTRLGRTACPVIAHF